MFTQVLPLIALASLLIPVPTLAVPGAAWVRRQEDAQTSLTLDPAEISTGLEQDGQGDNPDPGQVRSLTSSNNFINFCLPFLDQGVVLTNGAQVVNGSCNQVPMGRIVSLDQAPRCKFVFPKNGDESIEENTAFTVQLKILSMETGNFVNANTNYYAAPQQVNDQGLLIGHSHVVIEALPSLQSTEPLDPNKFSFFKGLNVAADGNGIISTNVTAGLPAGVYRICSINTAANHQPALVSNAQHGSLDDCSYFTIQAAGSNSTATANTTDASGTVADAASTTASSTATADAVADAITTASVSQATDSASATDAATDAAASTQTDAGNGDSNSVTASSDDAAASTTATPDATTTASDSSAPAATESAAASDNGNNNNGGDNNNNNNNNGNNNGGNGDNQNNGGNNNNNNNSNGSSDSVTTPAATESATSSDDAATTSIADSTTSVAAPDATPTPGNDNNNNGASDSQGGNGTDDAATSTV